MRQTEQAVTPATGWTITRSIEKGEEILLSVMLVSMILLACYQIALRWFTSGGLLWIDPLLRYLVLWTGLLGAAYATGKNNHISLDVVSYLLNKRAQKWLGLLTSCFSVLVSSFLFRATILFMQSEIEYGGSGLFNLPTWVWFLIFPVAFFLICLHFILNSFLLLRELLFSRKTAGQ